MPEAYGELVKAILNCLHSGEKENIDAADESRLEASRLQLQADECKHRADMLRFLGDCIQQLPTEKRQPLTTFDRFRKHKAPDEAETLVFEDNAQHRDENVLNFIEHLGREPFTACESLLNDFIKSADLDGAVRRARGRL